MTGGTLNRNRKKKHAGMKNGAKNTEALNKI